MRFDFLTWTRKRLVQTDLSTLVVPGRELQAHNTHMAVDSSCQLLAAVSLLSVKCYLTICNWTEMHLSIGVRCTIRITYMFYLLEIVKIHCHLLCDLKVSVLFIYDLHIVIVITTVQTTDTACTSQTTNSLRLSSAQCSDTLVCVKVINTLIDCRIFLICFFHAVT